MNRAERKHKKELRRRRAKQRDSEQDAMPYRIKVTYEPLGRHTMKGWEETAYENLDIKTCIKHLYQNNVEFRRLVNLREVTTEERGDFSRIIYEELLRRNALIPPYWIPVMKVGLHDRVIRIDAKVKRPERRHDEQQGWLYHFGRTIEFEGKTREVWFCTHTIDRIRERFGLDKKELDLSCWVNLLRGTGEILWDVTKVGTQYFLRSAITMPTRPLGDVDHEWSLYFPMALMPDSTLVAKTMLIPGMYPVPVTSASIETLISELKMYWYNVWAKGQAVRYEHLERVSRRSVAVFEPDLLTGLLAPKETPDAIRKLRNS